MVYESKFEIGQWSYPIPFEPINKHLSELSNVQSPAYNFDKRYIYFSANLNDGFGGNDIYYIVANTEGMWSDPINMGNKINTYYDESDPSISSDNMSFYFARNNTSFPYKNIDCKFIFYCEKEIDQTWSKAKKMPVTISSDCDCSPQILSDNRTLLISRYSKKTGWELVHLRKWIQNIWYLPEYVMQEQTGDNEIFPNYSMSNSFIYFLESGRKPVIKTIEARNEIRPVKTFTVTGKITESKSGNFLNARIEVIDPKSSKLLAASNSDSKTGMYRIVLPQGGDYNLTFHCQGYSSEVKHFKSQFQSSSEFVEHNVELFKKVTLIFNVIDKDFYQPLDADIIMTGNQNKEVEKAAVEKISDGRYRFTVDVHNKYTIYVNARNYVSRAYIFDLNQEIFYNEFEKDFELEAEKIPFMFTLDDKTTRQGINCNVKLIDQKTGEVIEIDKANASGKYVVNIKKGSKYDIIVNSPQGYLFYSNTISTASYTDSYGEEQTIAKELEIHLTPISENLSVELDNISFATNSADLSETSFDELAQVIALLENNKNIKVELSAHTDDIGSNEYNIRLSEKRANSVMEYLILNNIPEHRLFAKGYGEEKPLAPNISDENRALNRRVELKIIEVE